MSETNGTTYRDSKVLLRLLNKKENETEAGIKDFLENSDLSMNAEEICYLKSLIDENKLDIGNISAAPETKDYCDNMVCSIAACVFSSSCSGSACTHAGCAANAGGGVTPPGHCDGGRTCGTQSCSSNAGGTCGNYVCSYVSGGHHHDDDDVS